MFSYFLSLGVWGSTSLVDQQYPPPEKRSVTDGDSLPRSSFVSGHDIIEQRLIGSKIVSARKVTASLGNSFMSDGIENSLQC
jgi:hypothetical protein